MKTCPFCLKKYDKLTEEHIFPTSWYPENLPPNTEKWKAPSCRSCNEEFGKIEQKTLIFVCLASDPKNPLSRPALNKAMRSLNPNLGRDARDKAARLKMLREILENSQSMFGSSLKPFPNFGYHEGFDPRIQRGIKIPAGLEKIGEKFIRGIEYRLTERIIDKNYSVGVYFCHADAVQDVINLVRRGQKTEFAPGIEFYRAATPNDNSILYQIKIWDKLVIYGSLVETR